MREYFRQYQEALGEYKSQKNKLEEKISIFGRKNDYLNLCQAIYQCLPDESNRAIVESENNATKRVRRGEEKPDSESPEVEGESAEVEETQRLPVHPPLALPAAQLAVREVPVGDVVARLA